MSDDKSSLPASWRVAYGAGGKTVDIDPEQKPRNNDKLESQDVIGPYTDNYDTSDTLFTDHNQGREFEREGGRVFDAPIAQLSLRADNPIFEDQVERYVTEPNLDPIEVHQALVEEDDDITFVDGHTPEVGEVYWVINDGHHRALAAFRRGDTTIPARRIDVLSKDELRAYGNPNYLPVEEDDDRIAAVENLHSLDEGVGPKELSLPEEWSKAYVNTPTDDGTTGIHLGQARQRGYKVMAVSEDGAALVSMADARQRFPMKLGPMSMPGKGIFMSPNKQFVLEYYSGHNDREALLTFEFDPSDVVSGNLTDREPEISVSKADLIEIEPLGEVHTARVAAAGLLDMLEGVRSQLAAAAQHVYDAWQPNDEEGDDEYGFGGICDAVARAMSEVLSALPVSLIDGGQDGDDHAWIIAYTESEAMGIDIPPSVYETGGGYSWTKIPDVTIQPDDVVFFPIKRSDIDVDDEFDREAQVDPSRVTRGLYPYLKEKQFDTARSWQTMEAALGLDWTAVLQRVGTTPEQFEEDAAIGDQSFHDLCSRIDQSLTESERAEILDFLHRHDPTEAPSWAFFEDPRLVRPNVWLIHFTDDARSVRDTGFTRGVEDVERLGLTTHLSDVEKEGGGFSFAFIANSRDALQAGDKYGREAVMFRAVGVRAYHTGDDENQVIFWGESVSPASIVALVPVENTNEFCVLTKGRMRDRGRDCAFKGQLADAIAWVERNYDQYRRQISGVRIAGRLWYHGDLSQRLGFADQRMQNEANWNAMGPGIYFTSDKQQALGYAGASGYVYTAEVSGKFATDEQKPTVKEIRKFLSMLDDEGRSYLFSNWDENPQRAQRIVEATYTSMDFVSAFADLGRQGGTDYGETGQQWTAMMVKLGYAGMLHKLPSVEHLIVWDPNAITVKSEEAAVDLRATKEAAMIEAPPAILKASEGVLQRGLTVLAHEHLRRVQAVQDALPVSIDLLEMDIPYVAERISALGDGEVLTYELPQHGSATEKKYLHIWHRPSWASAPGLYNVKRSTLEDRGGHPALAISLEEAIEGASDTLQEALTQAKAVEEKINKPGRAEMQQLLEETDIDRSGLTLTADGDITASVPFDLHGSRYESQLDLSKLPTEFTLRLTLDDIGARGTWNQQHLELTLYVPHEMTSPSDVTKVARRMQGTLEHEIVHLVQTSIKLGKDLPYEGGSYPTPQKAEHHRLEHANQPIEFYPNLTSMVHEFEAWRREQPAVPIRTLAERYIYTSPRFLVVRQKSEKTWEKMVKEFMRAVVPAEEQRAREPGALLERQERKKRVREEEKANQAAVPDAVVGQLLQRGYALNRSELRDAGFKSWRDWVGQQSAEQLAMVLENDSELYSDTISKFPRDSNGDGPDLVALIERWRNRRAAAIATFELSPDEIVPLHEHYSQRHVDALHVAMTDHGWVGRPILVLGYDSGFQALTGTHRLRAAQLAEIQVPVAVIDGDAVADRVAEALINADGDRARLAIARAELPEAVPYLEAELADERQAAQKLPLLGQCDRIRRLYAEGEAFWQEMMQNAEPVGQEDFAAAVDLSALLEDDETLEAYTADDPSSGTFRSSVAGQPVFFVQTHGFEFVFADPARAPLGKRAALVYDSPEYWAELESIAEEVFLGTTRFTGLEVLLDRIPGDIEASGLRRLPRIRVEHDLTQLVQHLWEKRTAAAVPPSRFTPSEVGYVYYATSEDRAFSIASEGLLPHEPWDFTDQDAWPDGETMPRVYFSPNAGHVWAFAPEDGRPVLLRAPASVVTGGDGTGDVFSTSPVPADVLEIHTDAGWAPLTSDWSGSSHEGFATMDTTDSGNDFQDLLPSVRRDRSIARPPALEEVLYG